MIFSADEWEFLYKKGSGGKYSMIIYNPETREMFDDWVDEEYLSGVDSYGKPYTAVEIGGKTFDIIYRKLFRDGGAMYGFFDDDDDAEGGQTRKMIPRDTVIRGIRGELPYGEINEIFEGEISPYDYYDFDTFMSMIHKFLRGEITREYYLGWMVLVAWALNAASGLECRRDKERLYYDLSDCFDAHSFDSLTDEREKECNELIAYLKFYDHQLRNVHRADNIPFYNRGSVAVYICFDYCNYNNMYYSLCVADKRRRVFRVTTVVNPFFLESVNYTFVSRDDFEDLTGDYYDFYHDPTLDIHKYITELPRLNRRGKPVK